MYLDVIFVNVAVKVPFHVASFRVKLYDDLGGSGVPHEETVNTGREKVRVNGRRSGVQVDAGVSI